MYRSSHRSTRVLVAAVVASLVAAFAATSASAAAGDAYFNGYGTCSVTTNAMLKVRSPYLTVYGLSSTDQVRVWYRMVDDYGRAQSNWGELGWLRATATSPATYGTIEMFRGQLNQWSRIQVFIAWYAIWGRTGNFEPVATRYVTLSSYAVYGIWGSSPSFQGYNTACFG